MILTNDFKEHLHCSKITSYRKKCASKLSGRILDCGGGVGSFLPFFKGEVVVLDRELAALQTLKHNQRVMADAEHLPFADNSFDYVWACAVCQYLHLEYFIAEAKRVTRIGGEIWILVPNANSPWDRLKSMLGMETWRDQVGIVRQYSVDDLKKHGELTGEIQFLPMESLLRRFPRWGHTLMLVIKKES